MGKGDRKTRKGKRFVGSSRKRTKLNCYGINKKEQKKIIDYQQEAAYAIKHNIVPYGDICSLICQTFKKTSWTISSVISEERVRL